MYKSRFKKTRSANSKQKFNFKLLVALFFVTVFFLSLVSLLRADFLQVKSFEISGLDSLPAENVKNVASSFISGYKFLILPKSNKIFLDKKGLSENLKQNFGRLESVDVQVSLFGGGPEIKVAERKPDFLWCSGGDECFFMTREGLVFEKVETEWLPAYGNKPIFRGLLSEDPIGKNFASPSEMKKILDFMKYFSDAGFEIGGISFELGNKAVINTNAGNIIFNPEENSLASSSRNAILLIRNERDKNPGARFEYIDTRFGSKLFYKLF